MGMADCYDWTRHGAYFVESLVLTSLFTLCTELLALNAPAASVQVMFSVC